MLAVTSHDRVFKKGGRAALLDGRKRGRYASAAHADGRKYSAELFRSAPRGAERKVPEGHRRQPWGCPQYEQMVTLGRRARPHAFRRLDGREVHDRSFGLLAAGKRDQVQKSRLKLNR